MLCDGTEAITDTECDYYKIVGTTYQSMISEAWSYSETLEANIKMNLFGLFSVGLGLSVTTGYSWENTSNEVMNEETRTVLTAVVKPGQKVIIEQAVGYCDSRLKLYFNYWDNYVCTRVGTGQSGTICQNSRQDAGRDGTINIFLSKSRTGRRMRQDNCHYFPWK